MTRSMVDSLCRGHARIVDELRAQNASLNALTRAVGSAAPPLREKSISSADLDEVLDSALDDREARKLAKRWRGTKEWIGKGVVMGLIGLVFAAITGYVGYWWSEIHQPQPPTVQVHP